jgi:hypothetical protein
MARILVCGGRKYGDQGRVNRILDAAVERLGLTEIIHGAAPGADTLAATWALARGVPARPFPAHWSDTDRPGAVVRRLSSGRLYDAAAGQIRNQRMLDEGRPDIVIAFPGGTGTAGMIRIARATGVRVIEIGN